MKTKIIAEKKFDSVKMMRKIRNKIDKDIAGMTFEQECEYFKNGANKFRNKIKSSKKKDD